MVNSKLTLNCSTDSSNPVSSLTWRRGVSPKSILNNVIVSGYSEYTSDAEYNGKNITQAIDIDPKHIDIGETIFCCARYQAQQICDSMSLNSFQISEGCVSKSSLATLFIGIFLLLV
ncbi:uncharacterized protein LOC132756944 [Ruditapes philippinarum]|uniref:uncharacterized protein LOC132756944 n=1 Tax=Ruditapes philippinarum TaxID=129788 RepID=UPI00295AF8C6|nr:uncharacterized protein LOC132756944 [Ruditapes philippinarum]